MANFESNAQSDLEPDLSLYNATQHAVTDLSWNKSLVGAGGLV
jgi:hypothetical protein